MSHEITRNDSLMLRQQRAWHGLGTIIEDDLGAVQACERHGLGWEVDAWPVFTRNPVTGEMVAIPENVANVRQIDTPEGKVASVLGIVGQNYAVCQNRELAEFMDALAQTGNVTIETCGSIRGGKRIWFLARSDSYELAGGDKSYSYILGSNAHDGTQAIRLDPTDIRVVCANTLRMVVPDASEGRLVDPAAITIRHSGQIGGKLEEARKALREYDQIKARHREVVERLAEKKIDRRTAMEYFAGQYSAAYATEAETDDYKLRRRRQKAMDKAAGSFMRRFDQECAKFGGASAWLALNAWTGYAQHDATSKGKNDVERRENRIRSTLFGVGAQRHRLGPGRCRCYLASSLTETSPRAR